MENDTRGKRKLEALTNGRMEAPERMKEDKLGTKKDVSN